MTKFRVTYQEYCTQDQLTFVQFCDFDANDERHAVNQLLDCYKDYPTLRVICIDSIFKLPSL